ncbi:MAG: hypothetical protein IJ027_06155 [Oscillospiraceae bacterium]|nr:hypothetical protein [Oscillospiraceae bacterium]
MKTKRIISAIVAAAMMICVLPLSVFAATELELDKPLTIVAGDQVVAATFTPAEDGLYAFASASVNEDAPVNTSLEILDSTQARVDYVLEYQDFQSFDFYCSAYLTKGEQYILRMEDSHYSADGFTVTASKAEVGKLENGKSAAIIPGESISYLTFTPEKDGQYMFTSQKVTDADARIDIILDSDNIEPNSCDSDSASDDYIDREFYVAYDLEGGKTYTMAFYDYNSTDDGFAVFANYFHKITEQPTAAKPTVKLDKADGASYQWHKTTKASSKLGPEDNKLMMTNSMYDNGKWTVPATQDHGVYYYDLMYVELKENEEMTVKSSAAVQLDKSQIVNANTMSGEYLSVSAADPKTVNIKASQTGVYQLNIATGADNSEFEVEYTVLVIGDAIEGQTTDTLTKYEKYATYACKVSFTDGVKLETDIFSMDPVIAKQPTAADPAVEVTFADDVKSYEWYTVEQSYKNVTDEDVPYVNPGTSYDSATGNWTATASAAYDDFYSYSLFDIELKKGDVVRIESSEELTANNCFLGGMIGQNDPEEIDGVLVYTVAEDGIYNLNIMTNKNDSTFKIQLLDNKLKDKLAEQTTSTLTKFEKDTAYACVITYADGVELTSDVVKLVPAFTKQPTAVKPSVEVNLPDDVKGYQWYEIVKKSIDDKTASAYEYDGSKSSYDSEKGVWTATADSYGDNGYFEIEAKAGDLIYIQVPADINFNGMHFLGFENNETYNCYEDNDGADDKGILEIEIEEDGTYYLYSTLDAEIKAWTQEAVKVEGQTTKELLKAEAGKEYICVASFDDTEITSDSFVANEVTEIAQNTAGADDKAAQKELIAKVDELLKDENLTDDEKAKLNEIKSEAQKKVDAIEAKEKAAADKAAADKVIGLITALPETLTKADAEAVNAAKKAYDALTEEQKTLVSAEVKERLAAAVAELEKLNAAVDTNKPADDANKPVDDSNKPVDDSNKPNDVIAPETSDNNALFVWAVVMLMAGLAVVALTKKKTAK